ncbi:MAG: asparagine synthase (glutamine-hydrolyzing) [Deltaproteobacteria bacterium]|nr:asparagine synthase (glutamine-hydrolyzing) [Deltaproteobacteria bacterium]
MCGIAGLWGERDGREPVGRMLGELLHRGPDAGGLWSSEAQGLTLGHRRLAILDLSSRGAQPMTSRDGRWTITYNGELYNFRRLRAELSARGHVFDGGSDTEVLLAAVIEWGVVEACERAVGMFAFGLWDSVGEELWLGRDRLGKKPLYYAQHSGRLAFASELRALRRLDTLPDTIDRQALASYMRFKAVPGTRSIFEDVSRLEPGAVRRFRQPRGESELHRFWNAAEVAAEGLRSRIESATEFQARLVEVLSDAVELRMESDVPLGAFLSGGVDSSLVVALMQKASVRPVRTFSIGFDVEGYDEAVHAKAVAEHLGTDHHELYLTPDDARDVIPLLPQMFDEPFCDVSQIPTFLVSRMARQHVTVCLSGDGGDELFAGYHRYASVERWWARSRAIPQPLRRAVAGLPLPGVALDALERVRLRDRAILARDLARTSDSPTDFYRTLMANWREPTSPVLGVNESLPPFAGTPGPFPDLDQMTELGSFVDLVTYLPDVILVKVDRASMAVSLEARAPLLDHRIAELAWRCPLAIKCRDGVPKWPLKQLLHEHVPRALVERPKMGFGVPIGVWLRGPLREWAEDLLSESRLRREGYLDVGMVRRAWEEHLTGARDRSPQLWSTLMFESWLESGAPSSAMVDSTKGLHAVSA